MAYNSQNILFGDFNVPISATSDQNVLPLQNGFPYLHTLQNNIISHATFENSFPNIKFGSFSENYPLHGQTLIAATSSNQPSFQNIAFASFSIGQQNYESTFMSSSDLPITPVQTLQQSNFGGISTLVSYVKSDGNLITPCLQMEQNNHSSFSASQKFLDTMNHTKTSSNDNYNGNMEIIGRSRKRLRSAAMMKGSSSSGQPKKRIRFRFNFWTKEEQEIMKQEIPKCFPTSILDTCKKIAILLPEKSIRDVAMYIKSLIIRGIVEDIWDWEDPSPRTDLRDYNFYLPDDPNDPDLVNIRKMFDARAGDDSRV